MRDPGAHLPDVPVGIKSPELGTKKVVVASSDPSGEHEINCGVTIEDVGPEEEPVLVESRTDPSNIKYPSLIIDDDIYENCNFAFNDDVINHVDNKNFLVEKIN